jgi:hypothetical protein
MGIMPSEFWAMTASEFLCLVEMEADSSPTKPGGKLTRQLAREMESDLHLSDAEWWAKHGTAKN